MGDGGKRQDLTPLTQFEPSFYALNALQQGVDADLLPCEVFCRQGTITPYAPDGQPKLPLNDSSEPLHP